MQKIYTKSHTPDRSIAKAIVGSTITIHKKRVSKVTSPSLGVLTYGYSRLNHFKFSGFLK